MRGQKPSVPGLEPQFQRRADQLMQEVERLARQPQGTRLESAPRLTSMGTSQLGSMQLGSMQMGGSLDPCPRLSHSNPVAAQLPMTMHPQQSAMPRLASPPMRGRPSSGGSGGAMRSTQQQRAQQFHVSPYGMAPHSRPRVAPNDIPFQGLLPTSSSQQGLRNGQNGSAPSLFSRLGGLSSTGLPPPPLEMEELSLPVAPVRLRPTEEEQQQQQPAIAQSLSQLHEPLHLHTDTDTGKDRPFQPCGSEGTISLARDEKDAEAAEFLLSLSPGGSCRSAVDSSTLTDCVSLLNTPDLSAFQRTPHGSELPLLSPALPLQSLLALPSPLGSRLSLPSPLGFGAKLSSTPSSAMPRVERTPSMPEALGLPGWGAGDRMGRASRP